MRLIDVDVFEDETQYWRAKLTFPNGETSLGYCAVLPARCIKGAPTIDAVPVRHGHWVFNPKDANEMMFTLHKCSECGAESSDCGNYCSNCGAKMDEEKRK